MTLDNNFYVLISMPVFNLDDLNLREKILLALVVSFDSTDGLKISNTELARILDIWPSRVSRILKNLEQKGYITITGAQSKWRKIYLLQSAKVKVLLTTLRESKKALLSRFDTSTVAQSSNRTTITKEKHTNAAHNSLCGGNGEYFQRFYAAYPRKVAKAEAEKSWAKLKPSQELVGQIMAAVEIQKQSKQWLKDNGEFIPHPSTWLNKRRWEDELIDEAAANGIPKPDTDAILTAMGRTPEQIAQFKAGGFSL
jgi:DNA-binding MarR family transcriptional regulator